MLTFIKNLFSGVNSDCPNEEKKALDDCIKAYMTYKADRVGYKPNCRIVKYQAGEFLQFIDYDIEVPRDVIEGISIKEYGGLPYLVDPIIEGKNRYIEPNFAIININLISGRTRSITCYNFDLEKIYYSLLQVWKHGEPDEDKTD